MNQTLQLTDFCTVDTVGPLNTLFLALIIFKGKPKEVRSERKIRQHQAVVVSINLCDSELILLKINVLNFWNILTCDVSCWMHRLLVLNWYYWITDIYKMLTYKTYLITFLCIISSQKTVWICSILPLLLNWTATCPFLDTATHSSLR